MTRWSRFLTVAIISIVSRDIDAARVTTLNGVIEGISDVINGVTVDLYLGVPFAVPPVDELRFRAPKPAENWSGVRHTKVQPNCCMQSPDTNFNRFSGVEMWNPNTNVSEDCLYLNMYVPQTINKSLPTLIWIYGGSYVYGSITLDVYDGRFLAASQNVIVASMQYRMGVHGFFYMGTDDAPGNMALLDQQLAIKWIYDNIERFGGDPASITLIGESAGSASVSHHLLAPTSWPYFTHAIMLSSSSLSPWAVDSPANLLSQSKTFAGLMNCDHAETSDLVKCLRQISADVLEAKQWELNNANIGTFSPTVDGYFLRNYPQTLIDSGRIKDADILLGATKDEGEFFLVYFYNDIFTDIWDPSPLNRSQFLDVACRIADCKSDMEKEAILYIYEKSYTPDKRGSYTDILDNMLGDLYFKCAIRGLADGYSRHSKGGNTYVYSFEYRHSGVTWPSWMGVLHGYEIEMLFGQPFNPNAHFSYDELDRNVSSRAMNYISHFASNGNLDTFQSDWPAYTTSREEHIVFNQDGSTSIRHGFRTKECSFWKYLMPKIKQEMTSENGQNPGGPISRASYSSISSPHLLTAFSVLHVYLIYYTSR